MTFSGQHKDDVKGMGRASEAPLCTRSVIFCYKKDVDRERRSEFGFVAEGVQKINSRSSRVRQKWEALKREIRPGGRDVAQ